jgi:hypothetical protein
MVVFKEICKKITRGLEETNRIEEVFTMVLKKLPLIKVGQILSVRSDRFEIKKQEVSFLESEQFTKAWNEVMEELGLLANDKNLEKIFWRTHIANALFTNSYFPGSRYVECGTHLGVISRVIFKLNQKKSFGKFLFDTWDGIPEAQIGFDEPLGRWHNRNNYTRDVFQEISNHFHRYSDIELIKGIVPDTFLERHRDPPPRFLHIDLNVEYPERRALEFFVPTMTPGSVVLLDDYGFARHTKQRLMADKFFMGYSKIPVQIPTGQAFVIM